MGRNERGGLFHNGIQFRTVVRLAHVEEHVGYLFQYCSTAVIGSYRILESRSFGVINNCLNLSILLLYASFNCRHIVSNLYFVERRNPIWSIPFLKKHIALSTTHHSYSQ